MPAIPENKDLYINLGRVAVMAEAKLNGKEIGGVWIAPYRLDVTGILQQGKNDLEIEVVNLWRNRLIKDKHVRWLMTSGREKSHIFRGFWDQ